MADKENEDWKHRYRKEVVEWERAEDILWRATSRLAMSAHGLADPLDQVLSRIEKRVKARDLSGLEAELTALASTLRELDDVTPPDTGEPQAASDAATVPQAATRQFLLTFVDELVVAQPGSSSLQTLRQSLQSSDEVDSARALERVVGELRQLIQRIRSEKIALEHLVKEVTDELSDISLVLGEERTDLQVGQSDITDFQEVMTQSVDRIQSDIRDETDIDKLKDRVSHTLQDIREGISEYVEKDRRRFEAAEARNEQLQQRIGAIEKEASALQESLDKNREQLMRDTLTGVSSRLAYDEAIARELSRFQRYGETFAIAVLDIDHFKRVNDSYGHSAGDKALKLVASIVKERVREADSLFRVGGEEFVLLLPETDTQRAAPVVEDLREAVAASEFHYENAAVNITLSAGLVAVHADDSAESLFARADDAMYRAKKGGRNRLVALD